MLQRLVAVDTFSRMHTVAIGDHVQESMNSYLILDIVCPATYGEAIRAARRGDQDSDFWEKRISSSDSEFLPQARKMLISLPIPSKVRPVSHNPSTELLFAFEEFEIGIEWLAKHITDLIAMHDARPLWPWIALASMCVVVHVHIIALLSITLRKLINIACEMIIAHELVKSITIADLIFGIIPIGVLEDDRLTTGAIDIRIELTNRLQELFARHRNALFLSQQLGEVIDDEIVALFAVTSGENIGFLESTRR